MAKRTLLSLVPIDFKTDPFDEISLGYTVHNIGEQMMAEGVIPYSALDVFKQAQGGVARTIGRKGYLILGEAVSEAQYAIFKDTIAHMRAYTWLQLLVDNVKKQDREDTHLDRPSGLLREICRDIQYWKLCNTGRSICQYRPELRRAQGGIK